MRPRPLGGGLAQGGARVHQERKFLQSIMIERWLILSNHQDFLNNYSGRDETAAISLPIQQ